MKQPQTQQKRTILNDLFDLLETVMMAFALMWVVLTFFFTTVIVDGYSMESTLHDQQRLVIAPVFFTIEPRDIVVIRRDATLPGAEPPPPIIKRVIAMEGQTVDVDFDSGRVTIDGVVLEEPYLTEPIENPSLKERSDMLSFPAVVPEGHIFVMGDNRNHSSDSRFQDIGMVREDQVFGEVVLRIFPLREFGVPK